MTWPLPPQNSLSSVLLSSQRLLALRISHLLSAHKVHPLSLSSEGWWSFPACSVSLLLRHLLASPASPAPCSCPHTHTLAGLSASSWDSQLVQWERNCLTSRRHGFDPGSGRSPGEGNDNPLQDSCLGNSTDRGTWRATAHGVTKELDTTERLSGRSSCLFTICLVISPAPPAPGPALGGGWGGEVELQGAQGAAAEHALAQLTENHSPRLPGVREKGLDHTFLSFSNLEKNHFCDAQAPWDLEPGGEVRTSSCRPEPIGLTCLQRSSQACSPLRLSQSGCRREAGRTEGCFKRPCSPASRTENSRWA